VKQKAVELAQAMENEDGVAGAVNAFHRHLPRDMPQKYDPVSSKTLMERVTELRIFSCFGS
jgi:sterol 3beta-glucosyltransferase